MPRNKMLVMCALLLAGAGSAAAQGQNPHVDRIRVGGNVQVAKITKKVEPVYSAEAKKAGISGTVVLHAVIAQDGTVKQLDLYFGPAGADGLRDGGGATVGIPADAAEWRADRGGYDDYRGL